MFGCSLRMVGQVDGRVANFFRTRFVSVLKRGCPTSLLVSAGRPEGPREDRMQQKQRGSFQAVQEFFWSVPAPRRRRGPEACDETSLKTVNWASH